jgi:hypothetical protein
VLHSGFFPELKVQLPIDQLLVSLSVASSSNCIHTQLRSLAGIQTLLSFDSLQRTQPTKISQHQDC